MLVLSRKTNETIRINDDIEICVVAIRGEKVKLGIKAPADYAVHRQEVYELKHKAAQTDGGEAGREMGGNDCRGRSPTNDSLCSPGLGAGNPSAA